jgi:hypothetical protein
MQLESATKRRFLIADGSLSTSANAAPPSSDAELLADFVERQQTETVAEVESGRKPKHWRCTAFVHGLLAAGAAADLDLTLTLGHTLALVDAHTPLLRRLLLASSSSSSSRTSAGAGGSGDDEDDDEDVMGMAPPKPPGMESSSSDVDDGSKKAAAVGAAPAADATTSASASTSGSGRDLGAYGCLLDAVSCVWGSVSEGHVTSLVVALCERRLLPPDKVLAWMGSGNNNAGSLSFAHAASSHGSMLLLTQVLATAPAYARTPTQEGKEGEEEGMKEYLGDCAVAALDSLQVSPTPVSRSFPFICFHVFFPSQFFYSFFFFRRALVSL